MPDTIVALEDLERRIAALEPPPALMEAADALAGLAGQEDRIAARYRRARGIILNRMGLPGSALLELQKARTLAKGAGATEVLSATSREISRVHAWRGETSAAALELLRSVIEADAAADAGDMASAVAEFGRLNLETGRYEAALEAFDLAARRMAMLPARERTRLPVNRCEALAALGRHQECLESLDGLAAALRDGPQRDNFVARLARTRCLAADGRIDEARTIAEEAAAWLSPDAQSYDRAELALVHGLLDRSDNPERAITELEIALDRFIDDDLPRHEFDARILLAETLASIGQQGEAEACIVEALRRAEARQLPAMADRVRAAAIGLWRPEMIAELAPEGSVGPAGGSGRFLVVETLGSGGFGEVQRAIDLDTGAEVAIKRMRHIPGPGAGSASLVLATVRNEIAAAARISGRHVARTRYLHIDASASLTLVQDFVAGPTLRQALADGALDFAQRMAVAAALARTLAALHRSGIAHRDLKPDNVILRGGTQPVLIDLGLALLHGRTDAVAGLGTEKYAPPEQMRGTAADPRWLGREDVFALGRMILGMAGDDPAAQAKKAGVFGFRFGRRQGGHLGGELHATVGTMTNADVARREVDLDRVADLLDAAAIGSG